jgi:hypothetical protein
MFCVIATTSVIVASIGFLAISPTCSREGGKV